MSTIFLLVAVILFLLAAFNVQSSIGLVPLGLAFFAAAGVGFVKF